MMDLPTFWTNFIGSMRKRIGHQNVEIWFKDSKPLRVEDKTLLIEVENLYYRDWIVDNYVRELNEEASTLLGRSVEVHVIAEDDPTQSADKETPVPSSKKTRPEEHSRALGLNASQSFENFVVGECNRFAHAAAEAVANAPARAYNPLFMYGGTGLGKTHLMHAIGNRVYQANPKARIFYVTAEDFMNEMIDSLRYKRTEDFRQKYRKRADLLLVDDIQTLSGKDRTQEEFFHTFNTLQSSGKQIVLSSDVMPKDIDKLAPRLRTRFEGGLLADLQPPDKETLLAILRDKADRLELHIPADVSDAIANSVAGNVRELEGVLNRLAAVHSFYGEPITLEFARKNLPDTFSPTPTNVTVAAIIEAVARFHNLRSADITGKKRTRTLTGPRHIAMFLARKHTNLSFPELGKEFGGRDHSTIQYGFKKTTKELEDDPDLEYKARVIETSLGLKKG